MDTAHAHDTTGLAPSAPCRKRYFLHGLIPQLITFEACVRHGSVTRAAHELRIAQPTASCLVRKLAITFGGPLTLRRRGRLEPTALGDEVLVLAIGIIEALERFDARQRRALDDQRALASRAAPAAAMPAVPSLHRGDFARDVHGAI